MKYPLLIGGGLQALWIWWTPVAWQSASWASWGREGTELWQAGISLRGVETGILYALATLLFTLLNFAVAAYLSHKLENRPARQRKGAVALVFLFTLAAGPTVKSIRFWRQMTEEAGRFVDY